MQCAAVYSRLNWEFGEVTLTLAIIYVFVWTLSQSETPVIIVCVWVCVVGKVKLDQFRD